MEISQPISRTFSQTANASSFSGRIRNCLGGDSRGIHRPETKLGGEWKAEDGNVRRSPITRNTLL